MNDFDYSLLAKYLDGSATEEEKILIENWKATNPDAFAKAERLHTQISPSIDVDTDVAWSKVMSQFNETPVVQMSPWYSSKKAMGALAACFVACSMMVMFWRMDANESKSTIKYSTNDETKRIVLEDSSVIILNKFSTIEIAQNYNDDSRNISFEGEGYFDIAKNPNKPFVITMKDATVKVLGTSFNINCYASNAHPKVSVREGKVEFKNTSTNTFEILTPLEQASYDTTEKIVKKEVIDVNYQSWKVGALSFNESSITDVLSSISENYPVKFAIDKSISTSKITCKLNNEKFENIVEILESVLQCKVEKRGDVYCLIPLNSNL
jgi:transmembrane sensor